MAEFVVHLEEQPNSSDTLDVGVEEDVIAFDISGTIRDIDDELVPLYEVIDPDALNTLFGPTRAGLHRPTTGAVTFQYQGYLVTVTSENDVELELLQDD